MLLLAGRLGLGIGVLGRLRLGILGRELRLQLGDAGLQLLVRGGELGDPGILAALQGFHGMLGRLVGLGILGDQSHGLHEGHALALVEHGLQ